MTERPLWVDGRDGLDRRDFLVRAAGLWAGAMGAAGFAGKAIAQSEPFRVGWVRPTTGRLVSSFTMLYVGGLIAIDEINAAGGILGRRIVKQEEDDEASPAKEPAIVRKLRENGITYICGPTGSSQSLASLAGTTSAKVIQAAFANAVELGDGGKYPYHYQLLFNSSQQAEVCVRYLVETLKIKKIGILQENTAFGEQATAASLAALQKHGLKPVATEIYSQTAPDLSAYITNLRKSGAEGLLGWMASAPSLAMCYNGLHAQKWYPPITGHNGVFYEVLFDLVPEEALRNVTGTNYKTLLWTPERPVGARQQAYAKKLTAYPETRGSGAATASAPFYDFLYLLKEVVEAEKSFDTEKVKRALDSVQGFDGMLGKISFTPQNHTGISIDQISLGTALSGKDPRAMGVFRQEATGGVG
ncbi:ABC transporter substrate-binding protein [Chelatococcus reniformis]|uniref:Branched-chain amino acid ABC transporter substrate-binding protein n=1 Tax=Chelatococcus reniformis TaxID=1494448 RepID=A0A916UVP4_9HYPH|nr:ABC transporter substrate-binding protein [Chelatococcus reniformis]GGC87393.1 branched-chain amino acid ABC transporter substrate-binding protein [Chelatococcus reniformis]